jgi:type IV secretion system protein VirB9
MILALALALAAADPRVAVRPYEPARVTLLRGRSGIQSTISFGPDERIENVAIGDSATWQVTPNRRANLLFVKPVKARARTNMTVVTDRRTYLFDLVAAPRGAALYALSFSYSEPPVIATPPAPATPPQVVLAAAEPRPTDLNFAWMGKGAKRLLPARSFDDGKSLYLAWPKDSPLPAMLAVGPDGSEGPVNYAMRGDYIVIEGIPGRLILRSGADSATLSAAPSAASVRTAER